MKRWLTRAIVAVEAGSLKGLDAGIVRLAYVYHVGDGLVHEAVGAQNLSDLRHVGQRQSTSKYGLGKTTAGIPIHHRGPNRHIAPHTCSTLSPFATNSFRVGMSTPYTLGNLTGGEAEAR